MNAHRPITLNSLARLFGLGLVATLLASCASSQTVTDQDTAIASATSPDGRVEIVFEDQGGTPRYTVEYDGVDVVSDSRLGLRFETIGGLDNNLQIVRVSETSRDETWEQPWGERRFVRDHHNELLVEFADRNAPARGFSIRARVFNDGLGFRYEVPTLADGEITITDEITEFSVDPDATAWWIKGDGFNRYEYVYETTPVRKQAQLVHTPYTLRREDGIHVSIHEAALVDYSGMSLAQLRDGILKAELRPWSDGGRVRKTGAFNTPWRTIQIADTATGLLNSDLILNLNEPNAIGDVSWVETGKYVGIWWGMHINTMTWGSGPKHGATTENAKRYIDFAAEHGFIGVLIEGWNEGWDGDWFNNGDLFSFTESYPDFDIEAVADYAGSKGVRLIGHHETSGNISNYEDQLADAFALYERLGVRAVKTGYVADASDIKHVGDDGVARYEWHDGQLMARHHLNVVKEAAERKISINAHEPIKDTGLRRTYPNWVSREGARGMEFNAWGTPPNPPEHEPILAWTRMLSGPMDFTPGIFDLFPNGPEDQNRPQTTLAKQLALYVTLYSPLQMAADLPANYEARPDAFQFIKDVPADWAQSIAVDGAVGDYVVFARQDRGSQDWYLGTMSDEEPRDLSIALDFLEPGRDYEAQVYRDGEDAHWDTNPYDYVIETKRVSAIDTLSLYIAPGGGAAIRFVPVE